MVKGLKYIIAITITLVFSFIIINANNEKQNNNYILELNSNFSYINQMLLESSRFTQKDEFDEALVSDYKQYYQVDYSDIEKETMGYELVLDNSKLSVFLEINSFSVLIFDKETNYYYSSRSEFQSADGKSEGNTRTRARLASGIWIEYVANKNPQRNLAIPYGLLELADAEFKTNGIVNETQNRTSVYELVPETYRKNKVELKIKNQNTSSLTVDVNIKTIGLRFDVLLDITPEGLFNVTLNEETIVESNEAYSTTAIYLFPNMGSVRDTKMPGYMVIPDGAGALVRFNKRHQATLQSRFYNSDYGVDSMTYTSLSIPLYGIIHEVGQRGIYTYISEGAEQSVFYANLTDNNNYNRAYTKYVLRDIYWQVIDRANNGQDAVLKQRSSSNYKQHYGFLSTDASYVGMAKRYQSHLVEEGILTKKTKNEDIDLHLSFVMSDLEPSFLWSKRITMTSTNDVLRIYEELKDNGINNQTIKLLGWSKDGNTNRLDRTKFNERDKNYESLSKQINDDGNQILLNNDYVYATDSSKRVSYISDVTRNIARTRITFDINTLSEEQTLYYLDPSKTKSKLLNDQSFFETNGYGLSADSIGQSLNSFYKDGYKERSKTMTYYQEALEPYEFISLVNPNVYLWQFMDQYLDMPTLNAQYSYYTDLVPLIPIILSGYVPMYTSYLNFNAIGVDRLLMMVDFNIYPNYVLTSEDTFKMRYTSSNHLYTTAYADYKDEIIETYEFLNDALKHVSGSKIVDRDTIETGISLITYDNGVQILVNYTNKDFSYQSMTISPKTYEVIS